MEGKNIGGNLLEKVEENKIKLEENAENGGKKRIGEGI